MCRDNTHYFFDINLEVLPSKVQICVLKLLEWFSNNDMEMNSDKYHLILSSNDENKKIGNNGEVINKSQVQKLLVVHIDYELNLIHTLRLYVKRWGKSFFHLPKL